MKQSIAARLVQMAAVAVLTGAVCPGIDTPALAQTPEKDKSSRAKKTEASSSALLLVQEKGKFRILVDGRLMGSEEFEIAPAGEVWLAQSRTVVNLPGERGEPGRTTQVSASLRLAGDGTPLRYEWSALGQKKASATIDFQGGVAKLALQFEGAQPFLQELSFGTPRIVILDNNVYHHFAILARLYDWRARGAQTFPVLIPQDMTPGSITVESGGGETLDGRPLELLRVRTADLEVHLYVDADRRLVRISVPASKAEVRRE